ncbi:unnamed protein product [Oreochromis niloticus]|nr:unnamed protein product [Mustela putorius furo]
MEFVHVAVTVLGLLSLGHSAPVTSCENLIQPREMDENELFQLVGKWTLIYETIAPPGFKLRTKRIMETARMNISATSKAATFNNVQFQKLMGMCFTYKTNMELPFQFTDVLLNTGCPECLIIYSNMTMERVSVRTLQLLSRRAKVSAAELEEFTKQAECLNCHPVLTCYPGL